MRQDPRQKYFQNETRFGSILDFGAFFFFFLHAVEDGPTSSPKKQKFMDFSESFPGKGPSTLSSDGSWLASAVGKRVSVREVGSLQVVQHWEVQSSSASLLAWSPNSRFLMAGALEESFIQVWDMANPEWTSVVTEGDGVRVNPIDVQSFRFFSMALTGMI